MSGYIYNLCPLLLVKCICEIYLDKNYIELVFYCFIHSTSNNILLDDRAISYSLDEESKVVNLVGKLNQTQRMSKIQTFLFYQF